MRRSKRGPRAHRVHALAAVGLFAAVASSLEPPTQARSALRCPRPTLIDGQLACDEPRPTACEGRELQPGDALSLASCTVGRMSAADLAELAVILDPNEASAVDLTSLPGVGPVLARRILAGRPYARVEDLLEVRGIGPKTLAAARSRLRLEPANRSSANRFDSTR